MIKTTILLISVFFSSMLIASDISPYLGSWSVKMGSSEFSIQLNNDGSCTASENRHAYKGTWEQQADGSLRMNIDGVRNEYYRLELVDDALTFTEVKVRDGGEQRDDKVLTLNRK